MRAGAAAVGGSILANPLEWATGAATAGAAYLTYNLFRRGDRRHYWAATPDGGQQLKPRPNVATPEFADEFVRWEDDKANEEDRLSGTYPGKHPPPWFQ